ncbi:MAG: SpoIIE family protein phosphatase [Selenomonadaceae bacterium]|nr:SpoIIE family protein phosphatase [Selenomonadaceae bacterium]
MKTSIRTRVLRLLLSFVAAILLVLGAAALYSMDWGKKFASHYATEISNRAIDNSSDNIVAMRQDELLLTVEKAADDVASFTKGVREDVHLLKLEMERIWADPAGYRRTIVPAGTEDQVVLENVQLDTIDQDVFAFITYAPGVDPAALQEEIAVTSNIRDFLVAFAEQAQQRGAHMTGVLGTKSGFLMKGDIGVSPTTVEFRDSAWYRTAMEKGELSFTPVYKVQGTAGLAAVACTEPYRRNGEVMGVIGFGLRLDELSDLMQDSLVTITKANPAGLNFLLDEQGHIILCHYKEEAKDEALSNLFVKVKMFSDFPRIETPAVISAIEEMQKGGKGVVAFEQGGKSYTLAYAPVEGMGWSVGAIIPMPTVEALAEKNRQQIQALTESHLQELDTIMERRSILFVLLILMLAAAGAYWGRKFSNRLTEPLLELRDGLKGISSGDFDRRIDLATGDEIEEVAEAVNAMTVELKAYIENLSRVTAEKERISTELELAREIQLGALPHDFDFPYKEFSLYASMDAAKEVGGDFYDFYMLDERHLAITIADVSGKGVPAALFMMRSRTILKDIAMTAGKSNDYAALMTLANRQLCENNDEMMFVTVFFGVLDIDTGEFSFVNGGHNPPLLCHEGKFSYLRMEKKSNMLGVEEMEVYHEYRFILSPGDMLFLYTDGVTEAMDGHMEMYSEERLLRVLNACQEKDVKKILAFVRSDVAEYVGDEKQSDDITMLGVGFLGLR